MKQDDMAKENRHETSEKPTIVHLGTKVEVRLGYLDPDGNVIPQEPFFLNLSGLSEETFQEMRRQVDLRREAIRDAIAETLKDSQE